MNSVLKTLVAVLLSAIPALGLAQQQDKALWKQTLEICTVEENGEEIQVFTLPENGQNHYYLSVGHLGIGDDIIQFNYDPIFVLYIPLGDTLEEAQARLEEMKELVKQPKGTTMEVMGCLAFPYPTDNLEPVTITSYKVLLGRKLMFSVQRGDYIRATYVPKTSISSMVGGVKFYRRIHPKEK